MGNYEDYKDINAQSIGTENWWRHRIAQSFIYTDGVKTVAEKLECYWLLDVVASHCPEIVRFYKANNRMVSSTLDVKLVTNKKRKGADFSVVAYGYNYKTNKETEISVVTQRIGRTDIPRDKENATTLYKFYITIDLVRKNVIMCLPNER